MKNICIILAVIAVFVVAGCIQTLDSLGKTTFDKLKALKEKSNETIGPILGKRQPAYEKPLSDIELSSCALSVDCVRVQKRCCEAPSSLDDITLINKKFVAYWESEVFSAERCVYPCTDEPDLPEHEFVCVENQCKVRAVE